MCIGRQQGEKVLAEPVTMSRRREIIRRVTVKSLGASTEAIDALLAGIHPESVVTDPGLLFRFRGDEAKASVAGSPVVAVLAMSTGDVQHTLRVASQFGLPVVPRGAGTGLSGGCTAVDGCIVLSTERMTAIRIDPVARLATAEAGALNGAVKAAAAEHGLWYPPDPSSFQTSSIGGNLATNAGGLCCVKYGVTSEYVLGMEVVLADGSALRLGGQTLKNAAGFSLTKLFVGSEGTLGVITEATLRLIPLPSPPCTLVATFPTVEAAAVAVLAMTSAARPAMLELMDNAAIRAVEAFTHMGLNTDVGAMLLIQSDAGGAAAAAEVDLMAAACAEAGSEDLFRTDDPVEGEQFVAARRAALPAIERLGAVLIEDVGVALPQMPELLTGIAAIAADTGSKIPVVAHAGDGNCHPLVVFDPTDKSSIDAAQSAFERVIELALSLGGTITGEHGVGRLKAPWLESQLGPDTMALTRRLKRALDPSGILNPGSFV